MNQALNILQVGIVFLLMITVLIAAHELGHYLFARLFRMGIHEFAIGFGRPKLWTWRRTRSKLDDGTEIETEFNFRAWPLGGFVRILGMEPQDDGSERTIVNGFYSRPAWQRFIVLLAGPVFSVVAGLLVLGPLYFIQGVKRETTTIFGLDPTYGAYVAGVRPADVVTAVDGTPVNRGYDARLLVRDRQEGPIRLSVVRGGKPFEFTVYPRIDEKPTPPINDRGQYRGAPRRQARIGVQFDHVRVPINIAEGFGEAIGVTADAAGNLTRVFTRPQEVKENVGGAVTMVRATNAVVSAGLEQPLFLAGLLSISIGMFNLLPIPPLDGGQMLIAIVEMLRGGRRLSARTQNAFFMVGFALMITFSLGVFAIDLNRLRETPTPEPKMVTKPVAPGPSSRP